MRNKALLDFYYHICYTEATNTWRYNMIGENIKKLRIKANLTQDMIAEKLNVTRQALSKWENNKAEPDINMLQNIAIILGVTTEDLISGSHMVQINSVSNEKLPDVRLVGKRYRADESFSLKWKEWKENDWFSTLANPESLYSSSYVGAKHIVNGALEYWIGMLCLPNTNIPKGFEYIDIGDINLAVFELQGKAYKLTSFDTHNRCLDELNKNGMTRLEDHWCFEYFDDKSIDDIGTEKMAAMIYKVSIL